MAKKDDLTQELLKLGVPEAEFEGKTNLEMEQMIALKQPPMSEEEIARLKKESEEADDKLKNQKPKPDSGQKMYTAEDVKAMFAEFAKGYVKKEDKDSDSEEEGPRKHTVRLARINNKFILGMKNLNKDPYFPDRVIYSQDIFNEQTKQFVPHVTLILEEETPGKENTLTIPLETAFKVAKTIQCELVERKQKDASEKYGDIEVKEVKGDGYGETATGNYVKGKAVIKKETYLVKLPNGGTVEVIPDVVNW